MTRSLTVSNPGVTPQRGDLFPTLAGPAPGGVRRSTRDYYDRRNLAVIVVPPAISAADWITRAAAQRERAQHEVGEIFLIVPQGIDPQGLPAIFDDGTLAARLGIAERTTPAIFAIDRYGVVFATNAGATSTPDLQPEDIPNWLEFIACRCS